MKRTRVLIVDDSALMREVLSQVIGGAPDLDVVGTAPDPLRAMELIKSKDPQVLTLDVEMPRMDGLTFLEQLMRERPLPVIMVSSITEKGSELALRALALGAVDVVEKPKLDVRAGTFALKEELLSKIRGAAFAKVRARAATRISEPTAKGPKLPAAKVPLRSSNKFVAIGASTGGTEALSVVLRGLPADAPAVMVVQHMPARFTGAFAERLNRECKMHVREARDGDLVRAGSVLLAPGDLHMRLARNGASFVVRLTRDAPIGQHRPAVDALFSSCAREAGQACVGVLLTGMGSDGAAGMLELKQAGAATIAQDEQTCVVFGMPREAIARGAVKEVLPLERISAALMKAAAA